MKVKFGVESSYTVDLRVYRPMTCGDDFGRVQRTAVWLGAGEATRIQSMNTRACRAASFWRLYAWKIWPSNEHVLMTVICLRCKQAANTYLRSSISRNASNMSSVCSLSAPQIDYLRIAPWERVAAMPASAPRINKATAASRRPTSSRLLRMDAL